MFPSCSYTKSWVQFERQTRSKHPTLTPYSYTERQQQQKQVLFVFGAPLQPEFSSRRSFNMAAYDSYVIQLSNVYVIEFAIEPIPSAWLIRNDASLPTSWFQYHLNNHH